MCKELVHIPEKGISELKKNFIVENLMEEMEDSVFSVPLVVCEYKKECRNVASHVCQDGCEAICPGCVVVHATENTDHRIVAVEGADVTGPLSCEKHPNEIIHLYCQDCQLAACSTCLLLNHRNHSLIELTKQAEICREKLQVMILEMGNHLKQLNDHMQEREVHRNNSEKDIHLMRRRINSIVDNMHRKLDERRTTLLNQLDQISVQRDQIVSNARRKQTSASNLFTCLQSSASSVLKNGTDIQTIDQHNDILSNMRTLNRTTLPTFHWDPKITQSSVEERVSPLSVANITTGVQLCKVSEKKRSSFVRLPTTQNTSVFGITILDNTIWTICHHNPHLYSLNEASKQSESFPIAGMQEPVSIVTFPAQSSQMVISDAAKKLLWVKVDKPTGWWQISYQRCQKLYFHPAGLSVHDGKLFISGDTDRSIHILNNFGQEIKTVQIEADVHPWKTLSTSLGYIVLDAKTKQIVLLDSQGKVRTKYIGRAGFHPSDLDFDLQSGIYVSDWKNNSLLHLSQEGVYKEEILGEAQNIFYPTRICIDKQSGWMYVCHCDDHDRQNIVTLIKPSAPSVSQLPVENNIMHFGVLFVSR